MLDLHLNLILILILASKILGPIDKVYKWGSKRYSKLNKNGEYAPRTPKVFLKKRN